MCEDSYPSVAILNCRRSSHLHIWPTIIVNEKLNRTMNNTNTNFFTSLHTDINVMQNKNNNKRGHVPNQHHILSNSLMHFRSSTSAACCHHVSDRNVARTRSSAAAARSSAVDALRRVGTPEATANTATSYRARAERRARARRRALAYCRA